MINALEVYRRLKGEYDKTEQPLRERSSILPFGQYEDGSVGLAWPEILAAPAEGIANFGQYGYGEDAVPYNSRMAFDAAGGAMTGGLGVGLAGGMVDNAVGSAGGKLAQSASDLPMDLALERAQPQGIRAYHGSPHDFDRFSLDKIGAGHGAQSEGFGLYFSTDESVAKGYGGSLADLNPAGVAKSYVEKYGLEGAKRELRFATSGIDPSDYRFRSHPKVQALNVLESGQDLSSVAVPRTYEVNINAEPSEFFDFERLNAADLNDVRTPEYAAKLKADGFKGIKYQERGATNYVVFDDALIDILRKYSNAPTGAAIPAGMEASDTYPALLEYLKLYGL